MKVIKHLLIAFVLVSPLLFVAFKTLNLSERNLVENDDAAIDGVNILARGLNAYEKKVLAPPDDSTCSLGTWISSCLIKNEILISSPPMIKSDLQNCQSENGYCYFKEEKGFIVLTSLDSLKYTSYCLIEEEAYFAYISSQDRSGVICTSSFTGLSDLNLDVI